MSLQFVNFCSALVLEVQSDIVSGARLAVRKPIFGKEKQIIEPEEKQMQKNALTLENASSEILWVISVARKATCSYVNLAH